RNVTWGCLPSPPNEPSPTRRPTTNPWSNSVNSAIRGVLARNLFHRQEKRETPRVDRDRRLIHERRDDQMPRRLLAFGISLDVKPSFEVLVHYLPLLRAHRVQGYRMLIADRGLGGLV